MLRCVHRRQVSCRGGQNECVYHRHDGAAERSARATGRRDGLVVARVVRTRAVADFDSHLLVSERLHRALVEQLVHTVTEHDVS